MANAYEMSDWASSSDDEESVIDLTNLRDSESEDDTVIYVSSEEDEPVLAVPASAEGGNTKTPSVNPAKHWCFTFNNYSADDLTQFCAICASSNPVIKRYVFQEETGESGTPHLQGYIEFADRKRPMSVFKFTKKIHWEVCRSPTDAIAYCS